MRYTITAPILTDDQRVRLDRVAAQSGHPVEAVLLVLRALNFACRALPAEAPTIADAPMNHVPAVALCAAVCDHARHLFGESAFDALYFWHLRRGEDVGAIVYALIDEGFGRASDNESIDDFRAISLARLLNPEIA